MSLRYYQRILILSLENAWIATNATSRQNIAFLGSSLSTKPLHSFLHFFGSLLQLFNCPQCIWMWRPGPPICNECIFIQTSSMDSHVSSSIPDSQIPANRLQRKTPCHNIGTARSQHEVQKTFQASYQVLPEQISDKFGPFHIICSHWKPSCTIRAGESLSRS